LEFLPGIERVSQEPVEERFELGILVDLDAVERLGNVAPYFDRCDRLIVIDHHVPHQKPGDLRIVDTSAPATAVILTRLFLDLDVPITPSMATCLLTGIVTDTGSFRFRNTTPEALSLAAALLERGGNIVQVSEEIFQRKPLHSQRLLGHLLDRMHLSTDGRIAWGTLSIQDFEKLGAKDEDTEGFVNELLFIDSVELAAVLREAKPGRVRVSLRSRGEWDVAEVARAFGGGGHRNAAGCTLEMPVEQAEQALVEKMEACLASP
jgi:phosphoesterase RecJ-like protein